MNLFKLGIRNKNCKVFHELSINSKVVDTSMINGGLDLKYYLRFRSKGSIKKTSVFLRYLFVEIFLKSSLMILFSLLPYSVFASNTLSVDSSMIISHTDKVNSIKGKYFLRLQELLKQKSGGFNVTVEPYAKMANKEYELEAIQLGLINMAAIDADVLYKNSGRETLKILTMPYLFNSVGDYEKFLNGKASDVLLDILAKSDGGDQYIPIDYLGEGFNVLVSNGAIKNYDDLSSIDMFTENAKTNQAYFNQLAVKSINELDVNDPLYILNLSHSNVLDVNKQYFINSELFDSGKDVIKTNHKFKINIIVVNKSWFNALPKELRLVVLNFIRDGRKYQIDLINKSEKYFDDKVFDKKIKQEDMDLIKLGAKPSQEWFRKNINETLFDAVKGDGV